MVSRLKNQIDDLRRQLADSNQRCTSLHEQLTAPNPDLALAVAEAVRRESATHAAQLASTQAEITSQVQSVLVLHSTAQEKGMGHVLSGMV